MRIASFIINAVRINAGLFIFAIPLALLILHRG